MSDSIKSLLFAIILCLVSSLLLTAAYTGLKPFQQKNVFLDKQKNILMAAGMLDREKKYQSDEVQQIFEERIVSLWTDEDGNIVEDAGGEGKLIPIYLCVENDKIISYILPIDSRGLWGKIRGYLALQNDGATIAGFAVYQHAETPGLGGEIEKAWFQKNFVGKKIIGKDGSFESISIAKGEVSKRIPEVQQANYVDGISGASLTGKYLTEGLREVLTDYEPVSIRFRGENIIRYSEIK
ncbi:MAG: FMN-binding protein [Desulfobacterales bacterium]|nr:FMN-binding protein [Desulfobacterales bacterium]